MPEKVTFPLYESRSGWNEMLPESSVFTRKPIAKSYDFVVIGAGFTGLSTARRLAELNSDASIIVIEASRVGDGSSGRNSGFIISLPHNTKMSGHISPVQVAKKQIRIYESGLRWLKETVSKNAIDCGWSEIGKYHGAATAGGVDSLKTAIRQYDQWGVPYTEIPSTEFADRIGTTYYRYGVHTKNNVFVQPAALVRGLAASLPSNVDMVDETAALSISGYGPYTVQTTAGAIHAGHVIVANNGFAKALGFLKDRLITIYTYAGLTPELDDHTLNQHGSDHEWGLIPANRLGTTLRKVANRRFMVRSAYSYEHAQPEHQVRDMLTDCYQRRYPHLNSHQLEYVWGGATALTRNGATYFGKMTNGIYASVGCNGAGVLKGSVYGKLLAEMIMGSQSQELTDVLSLESPSWLPPEPLRRVAVLTAIHLQQKKAGAEK